MKKELLEFSRDILSYNHDLAVYYEEKRYRLLWLSAAIMGFSATFIGLFKSGMLVYGAVISLVCSFLAVAYYAVSSLPKVSTKIKLGKGLRFAEHALDENKTPQQNFDAYYKKVSGMKPDEIFKENIAQAVAVFYLSKPKLKAMRVMTTLLLLGVTGFFVFAVAYMLG